MASSSSSSPPTLDSIDDDDGPLKSLGFKSFVFDAQFHPHDPVLAVASVTGAVNFYSYAFEQKPQKAAGLRPHRSACRVVRFFEDGERLLCGSSDRTTSAVDRSGKVVWRSGEMPDAVNAVQCINDSNVFASGDDSGHIHVWDIRESGDRPKLTFRDNDQVIFDMKMSSTGKHLVATSGDKLGVYDVRVPGGTLWALSDEMEEDLNCCQVAYGGKKVVCGSSEGVACIFSWGDFGTMNDRLPGHPQEINAMLKLDEKTLVTGCGDGLLRAVCLFPNKIAGVFGEHSGLDTEVDTAVETLSLDATKSIIASTGHDNKVRFHAADPARLLAEKKRGAADEEADADDDEDEDMGEAPKRSGGGGFFDDL